jgi:polyhydroxybutyrate depolymerase
MAYTAACALGGRVTAIAVVAGYTSCRAAVPLIAFHGTSDATVPFDGGPGPSGGLIYEPVSDTVAAWAKVMGCAEPAASVPASGVVLTAYGGCEAGEGAVQLYAVDGGGHSWPGSALDLVGQGPTSRAVDATELMLDFFDRHR